MIKEEEAADYLQIVGDRTIQWSTWGTLDHRHISDLSCQNHSIH